MAQMITLLILSLLNADFPITNLTTNELYPCVAFANNQYYIFWSDWRSVPLYGLYGARVSSTGTVIDFNGKFLFQDSVGSSPAVAYDGTNFLVVWREGC
ncbi:MAG: hypothetical protein ABIL40_07890 [candidate division WOR-3 bacterium]